MVGHSQSVASSLLRGLLVWVIAMPKRKADNLEYEVMTDIHNLQMKLRRQRLKGIVDLVLEEKIAELKGKLNVMRDLEDVLEVIRNIQN